VSGKSIWLLFRPFFPPLMNLSGVLDESFDLLLLVVVVTDLIHVPSRVSESPKQRMLMIFFPVGEGVEVCVCV
jgi:hypothetical protein